MIAGGRLHGLAAIALLGYLAIARGVGNLYPFSTFEMYGATPLVDASRIVALTDDGPRELVEFSRWRCALPPDPDPRACAASWPFFHIEAIDRAAIDRVRSAAPPVGAATQVVIVRRVWRLGEGDAALAIEDCELARCEAAP
ncbi:MAG: hypothetical protein IAG13_00085 [Deltaproteobacteria bacterium]|nr:hypothetical protein [Nannocystaceae bacterium]